MMPRYLVMFGLGGENYLKCTVICRLVEFLCIIIIDKSHDTLVQIHISMSLSTGGRSW